LTLACPLVTPYPAAIAEEFFAVGGGSKRERVVGSKGESLPDQKENSSSRPFWGWLCGPRLVGMVAVQAQDKALRKRNLSGARTQG
jgi:hypothetical protein